MTPRPNHRYSIVATVLMLVLASPVVGWADLVFTFVPSVPDPVAAGSTAYVDLLIHSDSNDTLSGYLADITLSGGNELTFNSVQSDSYVTDLSISPLYVFSGASSDRLTDTPSNVNMQLNVDTILNASLNADGFVQLGSNDLLIARFELSAASAARTETYTIGLDEYQLFVDRNGDALKYQATNGTIEIANEVPAVPEPSSLVLVVAATSCIGFYKLRRSHA